MFSESKEQPTYILLLHITDLCNTDPIGSNQALGGPVVVGNKRDNSDKYRVAWVVAVLAFLTGFLVCRPSCPPVL